MRRVLPAVAFIVLVLAVWEGVVKLFHVPEYLLPAPSIVLHRLVGMNSVLLAHTSITAMESALGFALGTVFGILLAVAFVHSRTMEMGVYPYAIALKTVPIVAIAPLLIVWFGNGILPKVIVSAIISFFPVVVNTTKGLRNVDAEAFDLFDSMSASRRQVFFKLRVPSSLPYLFAALRISSTLAVIGAIVGEFSGADRGLGFFIMISSHRLETVDMFVGILLSSLLGILFFYSVALIERLVIPWGRGKIGEAG
ncbi:ABC transporter permease [Candidatus Methylomirabilis limnetica]|uniref:ABC transporter permease n=1 Tax=Candidatus Methylomirabilis limnetica TaxID=2033718 RepID=A0A2T4TWI1_9BACT|nr:ABC transporter permease [Candidatus Methylomirabilis limnetica]PTL35459.1 ABC transporter permease [Candidatus Methylomirabilis limnetica]